MDLCICTKREFYFSKKKKKRKKNQKGVLTTILHTAWPETFYCGGSASFCYFYELWKGTRKIIGFQRKPLLNLTIAGEGLRRLSKI